MSAETNQTGQDVGNPFGDWNFVWLAYCACPTCLPVLPPPPCTRRLSDCLPPARLTRSHIACIVAVPSICNTTGDGTSQTSDRTEPLLVGDKPVYMRGRAILDAHLYELEKNYKVRKQRHFFATFCVKINILPRQARDKHRKSSRKCRFLAVPLHRDGGYHLRNLCGARERKTNVSLFFST
jgi:hypothetical protein